MTRPNPAAAVQLIIALAAAAALKQFYSTASANELGWILWPTATLVQVVTGIRFTYESFAGYMSSDRSFLIAAPCSGVNFLITAWLMLTAPRIWESRSTGSPWRIFPIAAAAAFATTLIANTVRISSSLWMNMPSTDQPFLDRETAHRVDGILVYFAFLLLLYIASEWQRKHTWDSRSLAIPLFVYYLVAIGVPLANGAANQGSPFWRHTAFVFFLPLFIVMPLAVASRLIKMRKHQPSLLAATSG